MMSNAQNKDTKMVVYCMEDHMSYIASEELIKMGYTRIFRLKGGIAGLATERQAIGAPAVAI
jgi:rhodanese-related sulfurtransferase